MRIAVFTSKYPARVATFFERDMRGLLDAGLAIDVFPIYPLDARLWRYSLALLGPEHLPRERVHHQTLRASAQRAAPLVARRPRRTLGDGVRVMAAAARYGPVALAKTTYVLPKAWAWALAHGDRYDHVLGYWGNYAATCAWAFHRQLARPVPFTIWVHAGTDLYRAPAFLREKLLYADNIVTCCEFNRGYLYRRFRDIQPHIAARLHVVHHGLDVSAFPFAADGRPAAHLVAVGRLARHKGFDDLVRAVHVLAAAGTDVTLELVGDGPERERLRQLASELRVHDRVRFAGWLPFPEAQAAMRRATLLVHASPGLGDGLPNVVREAMALGTPVVATAVAGIPDALRDGCGVLVPPRDVAALADGITAALRDGERRQRIAHAARRRVEERYDLWRNGAHLAHVLRTTRRGVPGHAPADEPATAAPARVSC